MPSLDPLAHLNMPGLSLSNASSSNGSVTGGTADGMPWLPSYYRQILAPIDFSHINPGDLALPRPELWCPAILAASRDALKVPPNPPPAGWYPIVPYANSTNPPMDHHWYILFVSFHKIFASKVIAYEASVSNNTQNNSTTYEPTVLEFECNMHINSMIDSIRVEYTRWAPGLPDQFPPKNLSIDTQSPHAGLALEALRIVTALPTNPPTLEDPFSPTAARLHPYYEAMIGRFWAYLFHHLELHESYYTVRNENVWSMMRVPLARIVLKDTRTTWMRAQPSFPLIDVLALEEAEGAWGTTRKTAGLWHGTGVETWLGVVL